MHCMNKADENVFVFEILLDVFYLYFNTLTFENVCNCI